MTFNRLIENFNNLQKLNIFNRFYSDLLDFCTSDVKNNRNYFDFYLEFDENPNDLLSYIRSLGFSVEILTFDEEIIKRENMSECRIPDFSLLRIYNE